MLSRTFSHLPGISERREQQFWDDGITDWTSLYNNCQSLLSPKLSTKVLRALEASMKRLEREDLHYFYKELPRKHLWRLLPGNEKRTAFVDIETTGLAFPPRGQVTTIAILMNGKLYQAHDPQMKRKLARKLQDEAKLVVSYFGEVFDLPFLRRQFKFDLQIAHLDLCFALRRHGLTGGLKVVELSARIPFKRKLKGLDGFDAVRLWELYLNGNKKALETLLAYNAEDTLVLQPLAEILIKAESKLATATPSITFPNLPKSKFKACKNTVNQIMRMKSEF